MIKATYLGQLALTGTTHHAAKCLPVIVFYLFFFNPAQIIVTLPVQGFAFPVNWASAEQVVVGT